MGSVGSGVAGEQEFAMKSVGTRTTLPRAPPLSRRCPADRSSSAERLPRPAATVSEGTASSDERGSVSVGTGTDTCTGTDRPTGCGSVSTTTNADRAVGGAAGGNRGEAESARREREWERERGDRGRERERDWERERLERERERERNRERERERERAERERERERNRERERMERERMERERERERMEWERERERGERERQGGGVALDGCGNVVVGLAGGEKGGGGVTQHQHREMGASKTDKENNPASHSNPPNHNPPKILPVSGKLEQNNSGLVRPSAFKPVVPKSFHSMQNLVGQAGGAGRPAGGHREGGEPGEVPEALLLDQESPVRGCREEERGADGAGGVQGGMSDSGRNSLTSLPTYGPPAALGPLSASTSHINRLGTAGLETLDTPGYQNGLSASDSGHSSSGKSSSSYQRLSHLSDAPVPLRPSPSSDDIIQDLEDRLWEKEQEVLHMRRNLDQSEAAIVQVFEEKQRVWERQMDELRQNYASRLQQVTRRAQRSQNALQAQITRLSQDKRRLQEEMAALLAQREELERKCLDYRKEQADILPRLEETKWEVCQKAGEISLLKQQLRESQAEVGQRAGEMVALRGQLKELSAQLREREEAMLGLKDSYGAKSLELERCEGELRRTLKEVSLLREKLGVFEAEVLGLKRALGELGGGVDATVTPTLVTMGFIQPWGLHCPRTPSEPAAAPLTPTTSDALLSLQSDEAKAQRQEAQRQERQQRQEAQLRQEAHLQRQEAQLCQEAHLRQEAHQQRQETQWEEKGDLRRQLDQLQGALRQERQQRERQALTFDQERHTWQDEKERVLKYQAQLQISYVETLQKNQALEKQVGQLGAKLATTAPSPSSSSSPPPPPALSCLPPLQPAPAPAPVVLTLSPPCEDLKGLPSLHQLAPPWAGPSRLERIESTEI